MPIREGYAREVFIVSSGEMMALYAASNIAQAIRGFGKRGYARLCGIILNARNIEGEREIVRRAAAEIGTGRRRLRPPQRRHPARRGRRRHGV